MNKRQRDPNAAILFCSLLSMQRNSIAVKKCRALEKALVTQSEHLNSVPLWGAFAWSFTADLEAA